MCQGAIVAINFRQNKNLKLFIFCRDALLSKTTGNLTNLIFNIFWYYLNGLCESIHAIYVVRLA